MSDLQSKPPRGLKDKLSNKFSELIATGAVTLGKTSGCGDEATVIVIVATKLTEEDATALLKLLTGALKR